MNDAMANIVRVAYEPAIRDQLRQTLVQSWVLHGLSTDEIARRVNEWAHADAARQTLELNKSAATLNAEYKERAAKRQAERKAEREARSKAALTRWYQTMQVVVRGAAEPLHSLVELHKPDGGDWSAPTCQGCSAEVSGYEYDMEDWPCQTFLTIEEAFVERAARRKTTPPTPTA